MQREGRALRIQTVHNPITAGHLHGSVEHLSAERLHALAEKTCSLVEQSEVGLDLLRGRRPLDLHGHLLAVRKHRAVHLPDRGRRERREIELEEGPVHAQVELFLHDGAHLLERDRRGIVLKTTELGE